MNTKPASQQRYHLKMDRNLSVGAFKGTDALESDGLSKMPLPIRVSVSRNSNGLEFDFESTTSRSDSSLGKNWHHPINRFLRIKVLIKMRQPMTV